MSSEQRSKHNLRTSKRTRISHIQQMHNNEDNENARENDNPAFINEGNSINLFLKLTCLTVMVWCKYVAEAKDVELIIVPEIFMKLLESQNVVYRHQDHVDIVVLAYSIMKAMICVV
ncbi:PREDICTED: uncharacterized protein LOC101298286 isoform 1 [Fragaria vesca subsp. vesca]